MSDFWAPNAKPKARKQHQCLTCYRVIDIGETYVRGFGIYMGDPSPWKQCLHCLAMLDRIDWDDSFSADDYVYWEPSDVEELRVRVHYLKKWRNGAGELYPIPFQKVETS